MSDTSSEKQLEVSLWETDLTLSPPSPGPRDRDHCGRRIRLDRSRLWFPKHYEKRQGASDWSTLTEKARHPPYKRDVFGVGPHALVLSVRPGQRSGSVLSDHLVANRLGRCVQIGAKSLATVKPCKGRLSSTGGLAAGEVPGIEEEPLASHVSG